MKKIHDKLYRLIDDLNAICENLALLRRGLYFVISRVPVDIYYKFLLASAGIRKVIENLGDVTNRTKNVNSAT